MDRAIATLEQALRIDPKYVGAIVNRGYALLAKKDLEGAARAFQEATKLDDKSEAAWVNLGVVWLKQGKLKQARKALQRAVELSPDDPVATENLQVLDTPGSPGTKIAGSRSTKGKRAPDR